MPRKRSKETGYGRPPENSKFKRGKSGNPKGRPRGSKNFGTHIEEELNDRIPITENGKRKSVPKGRVAAKQLVNKAAAGDLKALQTVFNVTRSREKTEPAAAAVDIFEAADHQQTIANIIRRIRSMDPEDQDIVDLNLNKGE